MHYCTTYSFVWDKAKQGKRNPNAILFISLSPARFKDSKNMYIYFQSPIFYHLSPPKASIATRGYWPGALLIQQTHHQPCAKYDINGIVATAVSVAVGTQKQCGSSAVKKRMPVRDEYLALTHVLFSVSPRPLRWVFVVPVLVGLCWFQELLNWLTPSGLIDLVDDLQYWLVDFIVWHLVFQPIHK